MIKPNATDYLGQIVEKIYENNLKITNLVKVHLTVEEAKKFYSIHEGKPFFKDLIDFMTSYPIIAIEITGENAIEKWRDIIGPTDPEKAKKINPKSIRSLYGENITENAVHGSDCEKNANIEIDFFFGESKKKFDNCVEMENW